MSALAAALSIRTEFDTDHNGMTNRAEFGLWAGGLVQAHDSSGWMVGDSTTEDEGGQRGARSPPTAKADAAGRCAVLCRTA